MSKVVVITGASGGIGEALAKELAAGSRLVLAARRQNELEAVAKGCKDAIAVVTDVTKRSDVERLRDQAIAKYGAIDVWVNNAGRGISRFVSELTDEDVDEMMLVNVKSALYGMQAVVPHFKERNAGQIVNISSMLGRIPFAPIRSAYCASKHALNALTASLRMELAQTKIMVTSIHPGIVQTEFGLNSRHGGFDSRTLPNSQTAEEVAKVIADAIANPRADVYTREGAQQMVVGYFSAPDMAEMERKFVIPLPQKP